jgi:hypothetical protein
LTILTQGVLNSTITINVGNLSGFKQFFLDYLTVKQHGLWKQAIQFIETNRFFVGRIPIFTVGSVEYNG